MSLFSSSLFLCNCLWEELSNPDFKLAESREFKNDSATQSFTMSPSRWILVPTLTEKQKQYVYANEADVLNVALFGMTAKEWRDNNSDLDGNMRDYANILQLVILSNLENLNAEMIKQGIEQKERLQRLNEIAKNQYNILQGNNNIKIIENFDNKKLLEV